MARYRKVDVRIWNDAKFRGLSGDAKLVFFFLLTHPNLTPIGAMRASVPGLAAELGWSEKGFREAFREALAKGLAKADEEACCVWLPNFVRYNRPESPNVVKAWADTHDLLPECDLKFQAIQRAKGFLEGYGKAFQEAFAKGMPKGMPKQEQEQEQEQEQKKEREAAPTAGDQPDLGLPAQPPAKPRSRSATSQQGTRWPEDRDDVPDEWIAWARGQRQDVDPEQESKSFCDYWRSKPGKDGRKANWEATWRNWIRRSNGKKPGGHNPNGGGAQRNPLFHGFEEKDYEDGIF